MSPLFGPAEAEKRRWCFRGFYKYRCEECDDCPHRGPCKRNSEAPPEPECRVRVSTKPIQFHSSRMGDVRIDLDDFVAMERLKENPPDFSHRDGGP